MKKYFLYEQFNEAHYRWGDTRKPDLRVSENCTLNSGKYLLLFCLSITICMLIAASSVAEGGRVNLGVNRHNGTFEIAAGAKQLVLGMYPEIVGMKKILSPAEGNLEIAVILEKGAGQDEVGSHVTSTIDYVDGDGNGYISVKVRMYPDANAAAIGYNYSGGEAPRMESGVRFIAGDLPGFEKGQGAERHKLYWTRPAFASRPEDFPAETQFILWKDRNVGWAAAAPLVGGGMKTTFTPTGGHFAAVQSSYDAGFKPKGGPVMALAWGDDPYETVKRLYRVAISFMGNHAKLRTEKQYPEIFENIGWCSWNSFYSDVREEDILTAAASFKDADFPIHYMIVDDGWQYTGDHENARKTRKLAGFDAVPGKFPGGVAGLVKKLKEDYGIPKVGFWHAYQGYWDGINPDSELAKKYKDNLLENFSGSMYPNPLDGKGYRFFYDYHKHLRDAGADLVKVDNQSTVYPFTMNRIPIGRATMGWQDNLQRSVLANFDGAIINCMCMTIENIYGWHTTNIARSSDDFFPDQPENPGDHAMHNIYNSLWYSELTYPDFDMFQSHHEYGLMHSVLRAVSGGPIYITDTPGEQKWDILWKLIFSDGRILRPDDPARPTRDVLLTDPVTELVPLKTFTRVGDIGIVAAFNVNESGKRVVGTVSPADVEGLEGDRFVIYEHFSGKTTKVHPGGEIPVNLEKFGSELYVIVPFSCGAAPIGLIDKYISPAVFTSVMSDPDKIELNLSDGGRFGMYAENEPAGVIMNGKTVITPDKYTYKDKLLSFDIPTGESIRLEIYPRGGSCKAAGK